jgi:hypothetical protein
VTPAAGPTLRRPLARLLLLLLLLLVSARGGVAQAQDPLGDNSTLNQRPVLEADRDAFTPATTTVGRGWSMLESSYAFIDNKNDADINSAPETLFRHGLTDLIELRVGFNYEAGGGGNVVTANESSEGLIGRGVEYESYVLYGAKLTCTKQRGLIPDSCWILEAFTPTAGPESATKPVITYSAGWKFGDGWELDSAIRYVMGNEHEHGIFARWSPSTVLRYNATDKLQLHMEYFGTYSEGLDLDTSRGFVSPGGRFLVTPNFEIGLRVGWGVSSDAAHSFVNTGIAWRF